MLNNLELTPYKQHDLSCGVKVLTEDDLPAFLPKNNFENPAQIAGYLKHLTEMHQSGLKKSLLLPSLSSLSDIFKTPQNEVYEALQQLRKDGYDSFIPGLYGHISLFCR